MFIDARTLPRSTTIETDVCIIGAGAAGITLAREFIGQPFRVCLLEGGGLELDKDTQSLYTGQNIGLPYYRLDSARLRFFGGSTNHWFGLCRPLDKTDFATRDWVPHSGWPFSKAELDVYYERSQAICQLGPFAYAPEAWESEKHPCLPFIGNRVNTAIFQFSPPTRFGAVYRGEIAHAGNISTYLNANVVEIETTHTARVVARLRIACLQGHSHWVSAKLFVLAVGGIENPRLLLSSNRMQSNGLGNQNDLVGRFFMEHPHPKSTALLLLHPHLSTRLYTRHRAKNVRIRGTLALSPDVLRHERLLNCSVFLMPVRKSKRVSFPNEIPLRLREDQTAEGLSRHVANVSGEIDRFQIPVTESPFKQQTFRIMCEQAPNPESRVTLSAKRDQLGMNRVRLDWRLTDMDTRTIRRVQEIIGQEIGRAGLGRLQLRPERDSASPTAADQRLASAGLRGGWHHMGTTRMHADPKQGVVDQNCRVHGIFNLFIAGSSVFPTVGYANPTLTIVAVAIRLADRIKSLMQG